MLGDVLERAAPRDEAVQAVRALPLEHVAAQRVTRLQLGDCARQRIDLGGREHVLDDHAAELAQRGERIGGVGDTNQVSHVRLRIGARSA